MTQSAPLGDVADFFSGYAWKAKSFTDEPRGMPIIRIQNVGNDASTDFKYWPEAYDDRFIVKKEDLLLTLSGSFRTAIWRGPEALLNQRIVRVTPKQEVDKSWLYYALENAMSRIAGMGRHALVSNVALSDLKQLNVEVPPLEDQKRIAEILDQADALRGLRQRAIDRISTLSQAIFHQMFGDPKANPKGLPWIELGDVADFYSGNTLPEGEAFSDQIDGHLILKVSDLNHPRNQQEVVCAANWSASPGSRAGTCPPDALVFPKRGGAIGTNKKRWLKRSAILDPNLMGVRPNGKELTMSFLNGWFQTFNLSDIASGSSVPQLNKKDLAPLKVALPPVAEQVEYSRRIEALSMLRDAAHSAALYDEELFNGLQYRAFRGEL